MNVHPTASGTEFQQQTNQPRQQQQQAQGPGAGETTTQSAKAVGWFTEPFLRAAIAIIGGVLLLVVVALGRMAGVDTFSIIGSILGTEIAQWGAVAVFAILLGVAASKSWTFVGQ